MGRFSTMLQNKSPSLSSGGVVPTTGSRFRSLNRDTVATYDKMLYAQIMGVTPKTVTKPIVPARAESLRITSPVAGQDWRKNPQGIIPKVPVIPTMQAVRQVDVGLKPFKGPVFKKAEPRIETPAQKLSIQNPVAGQGYRANPMGLKPGEVRTLKDTGHAAHDAFDLWNAQGTKGVNGLMYWMNDIIGKMAPGALGRTEENKKFFALQMDLASDKARAIMEKSAKQGTWYENTVAAFTGGLSLLQSLSMGAASRGGQVAGQMLANVTMKEAGAIAASHLAKQVGFKVAMTALKEVVDKAVIDVGMPTAASWMPAWISSGIEGGSIYRERTAAGISPLRASITAGLSIAGTALSEAIELDGMYRTWSRNVGSELAVRLTNALGQAISETGQEIGQGVWQNVIQRAVGQNDEQAIMSGEELLDTIIGIFPSSFILGAGTFNAAAFRQQYKAETAAITTAIKKTFGVDDVTAGLMLDEAVTKFSPAVRDTFLDPINNQGIKLSDVLTFERSTDPYVQFLVKEFTKPIAETKQSAADRAHFVIEPPSSIGLRQYVARLESPTTEQQTTGRHKWRNLLTAQQQAAQQPPLVPQVGVRPEFQEPGAILTPPVQRPTGAITPAPAPTRAPMARTGAPAAIPNPQVSVSTSTAPITPQIAPTEVKPAEPTLFTAPVEPTPEERAIEKAKQKPEVKKSEAELAIEQAGQEAEAQQQQAEDLDLWMQTPDELATFDMQRTLQAQFDGSDEGQKSATLRQEIAKLQSGEFTDAIKADLVAKKAELRRLHTAWDDAHGWLSQVNRAIDLGMYDEAIANGAMTREQVDGIMAIRQQMQSNQDLQDTADEQLNETKRLRLAIEQQRESTRPLLELNAEPEETGKASEAWVGRRNPTGRELLMYVIHHYPMNKDAFDEYYGGITREEKANRAKGEQAKANIVYKRALLGQLMPDTVPQGVKRVSMDELADTLRSEIGLRLPENDAIGQKADDLLAEILYEAAGKDQKSSTVDYLGDPLETPAARAARARQQTPADVNPEDFANVVNERELGYTPEEQAIANRTGKQVGAVGTGETVVSRFVRSIAEKGDTILDFGAGAKAVQAQLLSRDGFNVTAYDFGQNAGPLHDAQALTRRYDIVMAGNVLNVQSSQDMLGRTLDQIVASVDADGVLVANLPMEPRKFSGLTADLVEQELSQRFENVRREGSRNAPVFVATNPISPSPITTAPQKAQNEKPATGHAYDHSSGGLFVEMVPTDVLAQMVEFDRATQPKFLNAGPEYVTKLREDIRINGIKSPIFIDYNASTGKAFVGEGNTRIMIAKELGIKEIPAYVVRSESSTPDPKHVVGVNAVQLQPWNWKTMPYLGGTVSPSAVGIQTTTTAEKTGLGQNDAENDPSPFTVPMVREDNLFTKAEQPKGQQPAFSKAALRQAEAAKGGLKKAVEATRELTTRQATQQQEELDHDSLFGGPTIGTDNLFDQKVEEPNPERGRPLVPSEDLFADTTKQEIKKREAEAKTKETQALQQAVSSVESLQYPNGARIIGVGISRQFIYNGSIDLTGHTMHSMEDYAAQAQIFRSPLVETMVYNFLKGKEIVLSEARSSRMPAWSAVFLPDKAADVKDILARAKAKGADGLIATHNHPSGFAEPSSADYQLTHELEHLFCDGTGITLKGHVIVDSQQYAVIHTQPNEQNGQLHGDLLAGFVGKFIPTIASVISQEYTADLYSLVTDDRYLQPFLNHPIIGQQITGPQSLADFAASLKDDAAYVTLIYSDVRFRVRLIQAVPYAWYTTWFSAGSTDEVVKFIQDRGSEYGVTHAFALYSQMDDNGYKARSQDLLNAGVLTDALQYNGKNAGLTWQGAGIVPKRHGADMGKTMNSIPVVRVMEDTPTGYVFDNPKASYSPQNLRFVDCLFTDFDDIVASFHGLSAGEYQKAVEGWWQHQVWEQLKAAKIPADVFKPAEVINKYRMSKGPKSTYNNMEWIKNKLEAWVREQATTELQEAKTKKLEPHAALQIEQEARQAGIEQKRGNVLAPQPAKKTVAFLDPIWQAIEDKGGYVQHPDTLGTDASTKDLLNIVNTYDGAVQMTLTQRKATRGMLNDSVNTRSHTLAEALGGGQALAKPFELPVITSKTNIISTGESTKGKLHNLAQGAEALEYVFRRLDKGEHHGTFWRTFYEPINNAKDYELRMEDQIQTALNQKISELGLDVKKMISEEQTITSDVRPEGVKLTVDDMMAVYLHSKNMDNLRHLLSPTGNRFTKQEVLNIIEALTPEQIQLADWMQARRQLDGILAAQVTWDTKMKNMLREQNYWMIERQSRDVAVQNMDEELLEKIEANKGSPPTQVEAGFTKERTHIAGNPIKLQALEQFIKGESIVQHYIATMPIIDQLTRIIGNSEFAMAYINKEGKSGWLMLHKWLQDVANPDLGTGARNQSERFMRWMRGNAASALLGFRVAQFFKAGLSWFVGAAEEGDMNAIRGVLSFVGNREATYELVRKYAPQVYHRSMEREIAEAKIAQAIDARLAARMTLREASMIFTVAGDRLSVMGLWKGKFDSYMRAHPGVDPQIAADAASEVVRLTQAAWDVKDQPEIQRSGEAMKLLTMFTNEVTRHYSYLRDSFMQYHEKKLPFGQLLRRLIEVLILQGIIMGSINRKAPPKDLGEAANDVVQQTLEVTLPVIGRYITNGMEGFVDSSPAGIKLLQELARGAANVIKIPDKGILPTVGSIATIVGYFYGLPVEGVKDIQKFLTPQQEKKAGAGMLPEGF